MVGVFVGGASRRMGGLPKGRLAVPGSGAPIIAHLVAEARAAGLEPVLVGDASPYDDLVPGVPRLPDAPPGVGPLGGLAALLDFAGLRVALAVGCDMPDVTAELFAALARHPSPAAVLAPRRAEDAPYEPMLARWDSPRVLPVLERALAEGLRSFQALIGRLEVEPFPVTAAVARALCDWDTPEDVRRAQR